MGFADKLKDVAKKALKKAALIGYVSGSDFPVGTYINFKVSEEGEHSMLFTLPNETEYLVTHDNVKSAEVLAMGVIEIINSGKSTTSIYGTKYKVELADGKTAILTVGLGSTLYKVEHILF